MKETIEHLKQYLQSLIDSGNHKIFYNDLCFDEKTIDCINAINNLQQENKQLKQDLKDACYVIEKLKEDKKKAREYIKTQQVIFKDYDIVVDNQLKNILEILGDKENE